MTDKSNDTHTADGVEITPGLWVWNNNLDSRQVDPAQFATDEARARLFRQADPTKTVYSEVWYDMLDGNGNRSSTMNGTRMATVFEGFKASDYPGMSYGEVKRMGWRCVNCGIKLAREDDNGECLIPPDPDMNVQDDGPWFHTVENIAKGN